MQSGVNQADEDKKLLLKAAEVAGLAGISVRSVWKQASSGGLPKPIRLGSSVRWHRPTLETFLQQKQSKASGKAVR